MNLSDDCVEINSALDKTPDGIIPLLDTLSGDELTFLDLKGSNRISLGRAIAIMAVSPDQKQIAYTDKDSGQLIILASTGEYLSTITVPKDWLGVVDWISADTLLMEKFLYAPYGEASSVLYNLRTGEAIEYPSNYVNMQGFSIPPAWDNYSYTRAIYNRTFTQIIYPTLNEQSPTGSLTLWDIEKHREIVRINWDQPNYAPQWTQDGKSFIVGIYPEYEFNGDVHKNVSEDLPYQGGYELFRVYQNGKLERLTYLTTNYSAGEEGFSLSPDDSHIAFWLNMAFTGIHDSISKRQLAILDLKTSEITNLCLDAGSTPVLPVWSPDGNYLLLSRYLPSPELLSDVILVDLAHRNAMRIAENAVAKGWLVR